MTLTRQARGFYATALQLSTPTHTKPMLKVTGVMRKALRRLALRGVLKRDRFRRNKLCNAA
jgi:hypothetical protein